MSEVAKPATETEDPKKPTTPEAEDGEETTTPEGEKAAADKGATDACAVEVHGASADEAETINKIWEDLFGDEELWTSTRKKPACSAGGGQTGSWWDSLFSEPENTQPAADKVGEAKTGTDNPQPEPEKEESSGGGWFGKAWKVVSDSVTSAAKAVTGSIESAWSSIFGEDAKVDVKKTEDGQISEVVTTEKDGDVVTASQEKIVRTSGEGDDKTVMTYDRETGKIVYESADGTKAYYKDGQIEGFRLPDGSMATVDQYDKLIRERPDSKITISSDQIHSRIKVFENGGEGEIGVRQITESLDEFLSNPTGENGEAVNGRDFNAYKTDDGKLLFLQQGDRRIIQNEDGTRLFISKDGVIKYGTSAEDAVELKMRDRENWPAWVRELMDCATEKDNGRGGRDWHFRRPRRNGGDEEVELTSDQETGPAIKIGGHTVMRNDDKGTPVITVQGQEGPYNFGRNENGSPSVTTPDGNTGTLENGQYRETDKDGNDVMNYDVANRHLVVEGLGEITRDGATLWNGDHVAPDGTITTKEGTKYFGASDPAAIDALQGRVNHALALVQAAVNSGNPDQLRSAIGLLGGQLALSIKLGQFDSLNKIMYGMSQAENMLASSMIAKNLERHVQAIVPDASIPEVDARITSTATAEGVALEIQRDHERRLSA